MPVAARAMWQREVGGVGRRAGAVVLKSMMLYQCGSGFTQLDGALFGLAGLPLLSRACRAGSHLNLKAPQIKWLGFLFNKKACLT